VRNDDPYFERWAPSVSVVRACDVVDLPDFAVEGDDVGVVAGEVEGGG
jgi:hypothetical protein